MSDVLVVVEQLRRKVPGGIGTSVKGLLQGLRATQTTAHRTDEPESASRITLFASRGPRPVDPLACYGLALVRSPLPGTVLTRAWDRGLYDVPRRFGVVHATSFAMPPARHARPVVTVHDLSWRVLPAAFPRRGRNWHERALRRLVSSQALVVVSSDAVAQTLTEAGVHTERIRVIPFGSDHLPEPDHVAAEKLLAGLGVNGGFLLCVGTLEPRKNLERLFDAYKLARARLGEDWPLVVAGPSGWGRGVDPREGVAMAGPVEEAALAGLYSKARLVAYVPLCEGYGFPPLEAMRMGTPVVSSAVPSSGGATIEVDPYDVEQIGGALVEVASDDALRGRLVAAGRAHVAPLTWEATARAHLQLWGSLA